MKRIEEIRTKTARLRSDAFEELCNRLLPRLNIEYKGLEPSLTVTGTTRKSIADAFKKNHDGSYTAFVYTAQQEEVEKKIKQDLEKLAASGINITKVVICINKPLTIEQDTRYTSMAQAHNWRSDIFSFHRIVEGLVENADIAEDILHINPTQDTITPSIVARLFGIDRNRDLQQNIHIKQEGDSPRYILEFGLAVTNSTEGSIPKGLSIRIEFFWDGEMPTNSPHIEIGRHNTNWTVEDKTIIYTHPAVIVFRDPEIIVTAQQPQKWRGFYLYTPERMTGRFILEYCIATLEPRSEHIGQLIITTE